MIGRSSPDRTTDILAKDNTGLAWSRSRGIRLCLWTAVLVAIRPRSSPAHVDVPPTGPGDLWSAWSSDPVVLTGLALLAIGYGLGVHRLWRRAGFRRGLALWQVASFAAGMTTLSASLVSPLEGLGEALFSAHMGQHIVLTAVAPPLLLLGRPLIVLWSLPRRARLAVGAWIRTGFLPRVWRWMSRPVAAFLIEGAILWGWHAPFAIHAALESRLVHATMHMSFLAGGLLLWEALAYTGRRRVSGYPIAAALSFLTMLHTGVLGALLTFAPRPLYTVYGDAPLAWGLTPLEDQQLAGLLMWVVCGIIYIVTALLLIGAWLHQIEQRSSAGWSSIGSAPSVGGEQGLSPAWPPQPLGGSLAPNPMRED